MQQKWAIFVMSALLMLGLTACGSNSNRTVDEPRSYAVQPDGRTGSYDYYGDGTVGGDGTYRSNGANSGNALNDMGNGIGNAMNDVGNGIGNAMDDVGDALTGRNDGTRYQDMVRNGRVHDTDGYLLDGENSHS